MTAWTIVAGVAIGWLYTMSPLLVLTAVGFALVLRWAGSVADQRERRCLMVLLGVAIASRILAVGGLFVSVDHASVPFGFLFGDEDYFIRRSIWLRNSALGIPISPADAIYAFDRAISTSLIWLLATLHLFFGPSPYGVRLVSALIYVTGAVALYRTVRPSFGFPASFFGLVVLLFLPSLFIWSISVLKEPVFSAIMATVVAATMVAARQRAWAARLGAAAVLLIAAYLAQTVREGGLIVAALGTAGGVMLGILLSRPRALLAAAAVVLVVLSATLSQHAVQDRLVAGAATATLEHWEHVNTSGHSYTLLEPVFYRERPVPGGMTLGQWMNFAVRGVGAYVLMPTPGEVRSRAELAYLPEQVIWYVLVVLAPIGMWAGLRRDRFLTGVLLAHLVVAVVLVALNSGNIGTLVRHRALALPCLVWFSGLGASVLVGRLSGGAGVAARMAAAKGGA